MIICVCNNINEKKIKELNPSSIKELYIKLQCKPKCCKCFDEINRLINEKEIKII